MELEDYFKKMIKEAVREELRNHTKTQAQNSDKTLMTVDEVAAFLKKPKSTIYYYINTKILPSIKKGKHRYCFREEILNWLNHA